MTPLLFYQVQEATPAAVDAVLPSLLLKIYETTPVLVVAPTAARAQRLDEGLWGGLGTLGPSSFLPHGTPAKGQAAQQPILLTNLEDDPAPAPHLTHPTGARLPVVLAGAETALEPLLATTPTKIYYLFSTAASDVIRARTLYQTLRTAGHPLQYFQQQEGRWVSQ